MSASSATPAQSLLEQHLAKELPVIDAMLGAGEKATAADNIMQALTAIVDETTGKSAAVQDDDDDEVTPEREERALDDLLHAIHYDTLLLGHRFDDTTKAFVLDGYAHVVADEGPYVARLRALDTPEYKRIAWLLGVHAARVDEACANNADFDRLVAALRGVNTWTKENTAPTTALRVVYQKDIAGGGTAESMTVAIPTGVNEAWLGKAWFVGNVLHALRCRVYAQYAAMRLQGTITADANVHDAARTLERGGGADASATAHGKRTWHEAAAFLATLATVEFTK